MPANLSFLAEAALALLRESPAYVDDARAGARVANTVVGSVLNLTHRQPRQYTERAVREALMVLDAEAKAAQAAATPAHRRRAQA